MSQLVLVDSSYYITKLGQRHWPFALLDEFEDDYDFAICGTVWIEVLRGRSDPNLRRRFDERFATMTFLQLTPAAWKRAAGLAWTLDRMGDVIQATDVMIAACAMEHGAGLLTFDRHFQKVPGLRVLDELF